MISFHDQYEAAMTPAKISEMVNKVRQLFDGNLKTISVDVTRKVITVNGVTEFKFEELL